MNQQDREFILFGELITEEWFFFDDSPIQFMQNRKIGKAYSIIKAELEKHIQPHRVSELTLGNNIFQISPEVQFSVIMYSDAVCLQVLSESANPNPAWVRIGDRSKKLEFEIKTLIEYAMSVPSMKKKKEVLL